MTLVFSSCARMSEAAHSAAPNHLGQSTVSLLYHRESPTQSRNMANIITGDMRDKVTEGVAIVGNQLRRAGDGDV